MKFKTRLRLNKIKKMFDEVRGISLIVFLILKIGGVVDWSWFIILAPAYCVPALIILSFPFIKIYRKFKTKTVMNDISDMIGNIGDFL